MVQSTSDFATQVVASHNDTFEFCENLNTRSTLEFYTYRPNDELLASRNAYLTQAMHYRSHQGEF